MKICTAKLCVSLCLLVAAGAVGFCSLTKAHAEDFPTPEELDDRAGAPPEFPPPGDEEGMEPMEDEDGDIGEPHPPEFRGRFNRRGRNSDGQGESSAGGSPGGARGFKTKTSNSGVVFRLVTPEEEAQPKSPRDQAYDKYKKYQGKL